MPVKVQIGRSELSVIIGDLTTIDADALVFYAEPSLKLGSGFGTAISVRGGPSIKEELDQIQPLSVGEAVVTSAGKLKAQFLIHAVGPRFQEPDIEGKLLRTLKKTLEKAEENPIRTIVFPPMGTGFYGIPLDLCADLMIRTFQAYLSGQTPIEKIIICAIDSREYKAFESRVILLQKEETVT